MSEHHGVNVYSESSYHLSPSMVLALSLTLALALSLALTSDDRDTTVRITVFVSIPMLVITMIVTQGVMGFR